MKDWFLLTLCATFLWGLTGFFPKLGTRYVSPPSFYFYEILGALSIGLIATLILVGNLEFDWRGAVFGVLTGVTGSLGMLFFIYAVTKGEVSLVVIITALAPLVTIILAVLVLHEPLTRDRIIAMVLAAAALILVAK